MLPSPGSSRVVRLDDGTDVVRPDVVIPLLHGPHGEDGTIQGLCEVADLPYVGPGVLGAAVAMDKITAKRVTEACGIPGARWLAMGGGSGEGVHEQVEASFGYPCFVKPSNMGSSVGVSRVTDREGIGRSLARAL